MPIFLTRVRIRNYKSIAACDVKLQALIFLVGRNGAGKSNFLDAIRFVSDSLRTPLDQAIRERGGIAEVRRRSTGHPHNFEIRLDFTLPNLGNGHYAFRIGSQPRGGYEVKEEECVVRPSGGDLFNHSDGTPFQLSGNELFYQVQSGVITRNSLKFALPKPSADRLFLVNVSGIPEFRPVFDALSHMGFYNLNPEKVRDLQNPDSGDLLIRDGSNLSSVLAQMTRESPQTVRRIEEYLSKVVPGVTNIAPKSIGPKETLEFRQEVAGSPSPWRFLAANMSDGTLRAAGILTAVFQNSLPGSRASLIGLEEPEAALHPAAADALLDSLAEASQYTQVLVTSHSPDLLDASSINPDSLLSVVATGGITQIAPIDFASRDVMQRHLFTAGELLRLNQLEPDPALLEQQSGQQLHLFDLDTSIPEG